MRISIGWASEKLGLILGCGCLAFCIGSARADDAPDPKLESVLSLAATESNKPLALAELFASRENVSIAEESLDMKRQERFYFEAASIFHNLAIQYKSAKPNQYLEPARQNWARYIEWYHRKNSTSDGQETFKQSDAKDRIQTAVENLVTLTADLVGPEAILNDISSGKLDAADFNNVVVERWTAIVLACIGDEKSPCTCAKTQQDYLVNVSDWLNTFNLKTQQKRHFLGLFQKVSNAKCASKTA